MSIKNHEIENISMDISKNFWIDQKTAEKLIFSESINSRENLKNELKNLAISNFDDEKIEKLFLSILYWRNEIDKNKILSETNTLKETINETFKLKNSLENDIEEYTPKEKYYFSNKIFSQDFIDRWKNPNELKSQLSWWLVWIVNVTEMVSKLIFKDLPIWLIKLPSDLISMVNWKWTYNRTV